MTQLAWLARINKVTTQSQSQFNDNPTDHNPHISDIRAAAITEENMDSVDQINMKTHFTK